MHKQALPLGLTIIAAGIIIILGKLGVFQALGAWFWPLLLLIAGAGLQRLARTGTLPTLFVIPSVLLAGLSIVFLLCVWFGWYWMRALWPLIPVSLAVGLFQFAAAERDRVIRNIAMLLGAVGLLLLAITLLVYMNGYIVAAFLIALGAAVVLTKLKNR